MNKLPNHTALKEWSSVIEALGSGEQVILIRKGGIADPQFGLDATRFYFYPTYFHEGENEHRARVMITHWCEVARTWSVRDLDALHRLAPLVAIPAATLETRYRFRPDQALHMIGVRVFALPQPVEVKFRDEYAGCRSWVSVDEEIAIDGSTPVLSDAALEAKLAEVEAAIAGVAAAHAAR
jgi:hypothetical protein